ncbi:hypothetical protein HY382_00815 [Candidatus Curtissbacteria bacterium]|nr:hypothetical protein [Candidatus Curtissbacteria bacterium]
MTIEADRVAQTPDLSYKFSEQIDVSTGLPVGLVPLEIVRRKSYLNNIRPNAIYHDIGGGTGASARYILSMIPADVKEGMRVIISEPYNYIPHTVRQEIVKEVDELVIIKSAAVSSAGLIEADVSSLINMVHLIPKGDRVEMWKRLFDASPIGSVGIVSTTFITDWIPEELHANRVAYFFQAWMMQIARRAKEVLSDEVFAEFRARKKTEKLSLLDSNGLIQEIIGAGFEIEHKSNETMPCNVESYDLIRYDKEWIDFITPVIEPAQACEIQGYALQKTMKEKDLTLEDRMPRNTLVLVFRKPGIPKNYVYGSTLVV